MLTSIHARFHSRSIWEQIINLRRRELALEQAKAGVIFEPLLAGFQQRSREDLNETDQVILDYARKDQAGRFVLVLAARISLNMRDKERALALLDQAATKPYVVVLNYDVSDEAIQAMREHWQSLILTRP